MRACPEPERRRTLRTAFSSPRVRLQRAKALQARALLDSYQVERRKERANERCGRPGRFGSQATLPFINLDRISRDTGELFRKPSFFSWRSPLRPQPPGLSPARRPPRRWLRTLLRLLKRRSVSTAKENPVAIQPIDGRGLNSGRIACQSQLLIIH